MISATLYGRIAREPELVQPMTGRDAYVRFSMAVETGRKDENGNRIAQFVSISVFGKQGNTILQYFHKGNRIACHVRNLEARAYADQSGQPRANLQAVLAGIEFVETRADQEQQGENSGPFARYGTPQPDSAAPSYGAASSGAAPAPQTLPGMQVQGPVPAPWDA